ncbi:hypothetical protein BJ508DRAFT_330903 [Ascobolus immersus RN42]|uniref:Uncharacterized protein n=1 Tax=Ascobolus immersus RN42 TaxID=1160509 RepID=A0A3N4HXR2_ASCIM|nr:hypothetical protein BJ508DRAFT_330903 [Ascobolus immersus RN42]
MTVVSNSSDHPTISHNLFFFSFLSHPKDSSNNTKAATLANPTMIKGLMLIYSSLYILVVTTIFLLLSFHLLATTANALLARLRRVLASDLLKSLVDTSVAPVKVKSSWLLRSLVAGNKIGNERRKVADPISIDKTRLWGKDVGHECGLVPTIDLQVDRALMGSTP